MSTKTLTKNAVKYAALLLLEATDTTDNLSIKMHLRTLEFHATQANVSQFMDEVAAELPLDVHNNGTYRTYALPDIDVFAGNSNSSSATTSTNLKVAKLSDYVYTKRDETQVTGVDDPNDPCLDLYDDNWEVTSTSSNQTLWFPGKYTRDEVRQAFSSLCNVHFHDVRARRLV